MNKLQNIHYLFTESALRLKSKSKKVLNILLFYIVNYL